jgi:hypothetical protein
VTSLTQKDNTTVSCGKSVTEGELINNETIPELSYSCCDIVRFNIDFAGSRLLSLQINYSMNLEAPCFNKRSVTVYWQHYFIISESEGLFLYFFPERYLYTGHVITRDHYFLITISRNNDKN